MSKNDIGEIIERLARIETRLSNGICQDMEDHERRLRFLERGFWTAFGALAILQVILKFIPFPATGGH
ncbi:MAG: hypothetical protein ABIN58_00855 [candidate division WOR-3 bacterium]